MTAQTKMPTPVLIAVDWGTTACRAALLAADGRDLAPPTRGPGILAVTERAFGPALERMIAPWTASWPELPVVLSGMIGSRQGWVETPYVRCPASLTEIAANRVQIKDTAIPQLFVIPGLDTIGTGNMPDVMRGEETQVFGALNAVSGHSGRFVLPGTHSKWATVEHHRITSFRTYMTGEIYAALKDHTILGRLMSQAPVATAAAHPAFVTGVRAGAAPGGPGALLHRAFAARTLGLFEHLSAEALPEYLSGLLIGAEVAEGGGLATIIANDALAARYQAAGDALGVELTVAPSNCAALGALAMARAAGLLR
jgi:2-dehydro-3-deoxygalactonokinase